MTSYKGKSLASLPDDILVMLPNYLHDIEDFMNLSSTCRTLKKWIEKSATPNTILRLAVAASRIFFRPSPHFLVAATARELGNWARMSESNEKELVVDIEIGTDHLMNLAIDHCGITMERIRTLHLMRFSIINPVVNLMDQCVGRQWYELPDFWTSVDDAYTIDADPSESFFHLAIYGELFGPDFEPLLNSECSARRLSVETRLEYVKYCIPDYAANCWDSARGIRLADGSIDPRRAIKHHPKGPYIKKDGKFLHDNNIAMKWILKSKRWRPHWKVTRQAAGADFSEGFYDEIGDMENWRQLLWETVMVCQGIEGLGMCFPATSSHWTEKIKEWRDRIAGLEEEPAKVQVGRQITHEYPDIYGDLLICSSGHVGGS